MSRQLVIPVEEAGQRVDKLLAASLEDMTRSAIQNLIEIGCVTCQGKILSKSAKLKPGDQILVELPQVRPLEVLPENIPLDIVYEDSDLLVVNKPKGMVVHPAPGHEQGTLVNALLYHCGDSLSGINGVARPGIVHRIDKDTSGLLIVAKNDFSHTRLAEQIQAHSFTREYSAVVYGSFKEDFGTVDQPLGRRPTDRKKIAVLPPITLCQTCCDPLLGRKAFSGFYPAAAAFGNRTYTPNSGAHGFFRPSRGWGPCVWPQKSDNFSRRAMPARRKDRVCPSSFRSVFGI